MTEEKLPDTQPENPLTPEEQALPTQTQADILLARKMVSFGIEAGAGAEDIARVCGMLALNMCQQMPDPQLGYRTLQGIMQKTWDSMMKATRAKTRIIMPGQ